MKRRKYQWIRKLEEPKVRCISKLEEARRNWIAMNEDKSYEKLAKKIAKNFAKTYEKYNTKQLYYDYLSLHHNKNNYIVLLFSKKTGFYYFYFRFTNFSGAKLADAVGKTLRLWNYPVQEVSCMEDIFNIIWLSASLE